MADLIFYTNPQSRGRIVRWMLEEVGQPYETEIIPYDQMKSERYLAINPMGKVPAIKHNGHVVTECAAICAYLADVFPQAMLGPKADENADYYRWLFYAAGPLEAAISNQAMGWQVPAEQERMFGYGNFDKAIAAARRAVQPSRLCLRRSLHRGGRLRRLATDVSDAVRNASRAQELPFISRSASGPASLQARERDRREDHRRDGPASAAASASVEILTTRCGLRCAR